MIDISSNIEEVERVLSDKGRNQLPFALSQSLNDTTDAVRDRWASLIASELDRPTPFTKRGLFNRRSSKVRLVATVGVKDIQAGYLEFQARGGRRRPDGRAILVPVNARLNRYGNMSRGAVKRLLAQPTVFSGRVKNVPGIYRRIRGGVKLLVAYEDTVDYSARLPLQRRADDAGRALFPVLFERRFRAAMATRR